MTDEKRRKDRNLNIRLSDSERKRLEAQAKRAGRTMAGQVVYLLDRYEWDELPGATEQLLECVRKALEDKDICKV